MSWLLSCQVFGVVATFLLGFWCGGYFPAKSLVWWLLGCIVFGVVGIAVVATFLRGFWCGSCFPACFLFGAWVLVRWLFPCLALVVLCVWRHGDKGPKYVSNRFPKTVELSGYPRTIMLPRVCCKFR